MIEYTEKDEMLEDLMDIADYIAYNNKDFICSTCLEVLDRLKAFTAKFYGMNAYYEMDNMITSTMEEEGEE